jgi:hypothetical protein
MSAHDPAQAFLPDTNHFSEKNTTQNTSQVSQVIDQILSSQEDFEWMEKCINVFMNDDEEGIPMVGSSNKTSSSHVQQQTSGVKRQLYESNQDSENKHYGELSTITSNPSLDIDDIKTMPVDDAAAVVSLEAARMNARKAFSSLRKQAVASVVIQKSLVSWWKQRRNVES